MSSGDAARFRDDEYGKSEPSGMGSSSSARNDSAHKGEKDKEKKEKDKEDRDEGKKATTIASLDEFKKMFFFSLLETIKVFDGNCSLRRRIFRAITVPRACTLEQLLTTALRAFHIAKEPSVSFFDKNNLKDSSYKGFSFQQFYLTDLYATNGDEIQIQDPTPVLNLHKIEGKRPAIFLRFR